MASGELEVESAAFEHDQGDEVVEVPVAVADLDGGLDPVVHGLEPCVGRSADMLSRERPVVDDEQARVAETFKKLHRGDMGIVAYEDEHKFDGDGDKPA